MTPLTVNLAPVAGPGNQVLGRKYTSLGRGHAVGHCVSVRRSSQAPRWPSEARRGHTRRQGEPLVRVHRSVHDIADATVAVVGPLEGGRDKL